MGKFDPVEGEIEEFEFEFELLNSEDLTVVTLVCRSDRPLSPNEYALALKEFSDRIESLTQLAELSSGTSH